MDDNSEVWMNPRSKRPVKKYRARYLKLRKQHETYLDKQTKSQMKLKGNKRKMVDDEEDDDDSSLSDDPIPVVSSEEDSQAESEEDLGDYNPEHYENKDANEDDEDEDDDDDDDGGMEDDDPISNDEYSPVVSKRQRKSTSRMEASTKTKTKKKIPAVVIEADSIIARNYSTIKKARDTLSNEDFRKWVINFVNGVSRTKN